MKKLFYKLYRLIKDETKIVEEDNSRKEHPFNTASLQHNSSIL